MVENVHTYGLIVIGSGPAGVSAVAAYDKAGGEGPVLLLTADPTAPYERPPLTKASLRADATPEPTPLVEHGGATDLDLRLGMPVSHLDLDRRVVEAGGESFRYERLILAPGAQPLPLPSAEAGADLHVLRSFADLERLAQSAGHARTAVVIGSGFIGCEAAISLALRGLDVTLVSQESAPQVDRLGERAAALIADLLEGHGVSLRLGVEVATVQAPRTIHLSDGTTLAPDLVLAALGVEPSTHFLDGSALQMHEGRVVVDEHLAATVDGVWAAGDAARAMHAVAGRPIPVEHWGDALAMGEVAGRNAAGERAAWQTVPGFWSELGEHQLKYVAWGDGHDEVVVDEAPGRLTVWYGRGGLLAGVLTYNADDDLERGQGLIHQGAELAAGMRGDRPESEDDFSEAKEG